MRGRSLQSLSLVGPTRIFPCSELGAGQSAAEEFPPCEDGPQSHEQLGSGPVLNDIAECTYLERCLYHREGRLLREKYDLG